MQAGALEVLCEHAQSSNPRLRLEATWALKHLVFSASHEVKFACLEELGQGGLIQLICGDIEEMRSTVGGGSGTSDPMEMSVDISNGGGSGIVQPESIVDDRPAHESFEETLEQEDNDGDDDREMKLDEPTSNTHGRHHNQSNVNPPQSTTTSNQPTKPSSTNKNNNLNTKLTALREAELNPAKQSQCDSLAIQEQGLDFIRNLINGPKSDEIIDRLITYFNGPDQLFNILSSKLRPSTGPYSQPATETITATLFILVHIAASAPRHRALITSQTHLLKQLLPLFQHPSKNVRGPLVFLVINITWVDDQSDESAAKTRAAELKRLGFQAELEALLHDPELDVRERARNGLCQLK